MQMNDPEQRQKPYTELAARFMLCLVHWNNIEDKSSIILDQLADLKHILQTQFAIDLKLQFILLTFFEC